MAEDDASAILHGATKDMVSGFLVQWNRYINFLYRAGDLQGEGSQGYLAVDSMKRFRSP